MFNYENTVTGKMDVSKIWNLYSDVSKWTQWDTGLEKVELEGPFEKGSTGTMVMPKMPPLAFVLDEVVENKTFVDTATLGGITVTFGHYIFETDNGEVEIKHTVNIKAGNPGQAQGMGQGITSGIPAAMEKLSELTK